MGGIGNFMVPDALALIAARSDIAEKNDAQKKRSIWPASS